MRYFRKFLFGFVCVLLCCGFEFGCTAPSHDRSFSKKHLLRAMASDLDSTVVSAHLEVGLDTDKNVIWCSTFQLAWNKACDLVGEDLHFKDEPPMVDVLNKRQTKGSDVDSKSYVALAGHIRDGILNDIKRELNRKFKGAASPELIPDGFGMRPQDIVAYSYLFKNLEFPQKFERLNRPISFEKSDVLCFGIGEEYKNGHGGMLKQVSILDYKNDDDFIIELKTKSPVDQVILAKIKPGGNLKSCIDEVLKRMSKTTPSKMQYGDILKIPKMNYNIHRKYNELMAKKLIVRNPKIAQDLSVLSADQLIRFQMDEEGVKLKSESSMNFGCSTTYRPQPEHRLIFDKPFLVLLKNSDADMPYFAMWISNKELLAPWK